MADRQQSRYPNHKRRNRRRIMQARQAKRLRRRQRVKGAGRWEAKS